MIKKDKNLEPCSYFKYSHKLTELSHHSPSLSPAGLSRSKRRPYIIQNGVTHYNVFYNKPENLRELTPIHFHHLYPMYTKKPSKPDSNFLPKLRTLKLHLKSKTLISYSSSNREKTLKDESMGTDD